MKWKPRSSGMGNAADKVVALRNLTALVCAPSSQIED
jgi:hypothetical protein